MILCFILLQGWLMVMIMLFTSTMIFTYLVPRCNVFVSMVIAPTD